MSSPAFEIPPQLVSLKPVKRSFTILNSGSKEKSPMFIGNILTIPPVHVVGPYADTDADGQPIPGSRVVEDLYVFLPDFAEDVLVFDAVRAVCHILGLQPGSDQNATVATSPFAINGLSLLPRHPPKSQWKKIAAEGEKRAFVAEVGRARTFLKALDETNLIRKKHNMEPVVDDQVEYDRAKFVIDQYNSMMKAMMPLAPHQQDKLNEDIEFEVWAKAQAQELAAKASIGRTIDSAKLAEDLLNDPSIRLKLQKKFRIRNVGEMPKTRKELEQEMKVRAAEEAKAVAAAALEDELARTPGDDGYDGTGPVNDTDTPDDPEKAN